VLVLAAGPHPSAQAGPEPTQAERAAVLAAEMRRDSAALHPFLKAAPGSRIRRLAIRALGRIGDDRTGPGILRDVLAAPAADDPDLDLWIWSAGVARAAELAEPLGAQLDAHLAAGRLDLAAAAARSLGWTGAQDVGAKLLPLLAHASPLVRAGALDGLGRARIATRDVLEAASRLVFDADAEVREAAAFAAWMAAGGWRRARREEDPAWGGDSALAARFLSLLAEPEPERRMAGIRVLGALLPEELQEREAHAAVFALVDDPDPRVVQDAVWRVFGPRSGPDVEAAVVRALSHGDEKVRQLAAETLLDDDEPTAAQVAALEARFAVETDPRLREVLAVQLARGTGDLVHWRRLRETGARAADPVVRQQTDAEVLLATRKPEHLEELLRFADPGASQRVDLHPATWLAILAGLEGRAHPLLEAWLAGFLAGGYAVPRDDREAVIAAAISLVGTNGLFALAPRVLGLLEEAPFGPPGPQVRQARVEALAALIARADAPAGLQEPLRAAVREALADASPWVRRAARDAARALELPDVPELDEGQPNEWRGVPRAQEPWAGVDPQGEGAWLDEAGILQLADWIAAHEPRVVLETTCGPIEIALDAESAPVHAVSLLNAVRNGVYTDTRWHRVVPDFVVQGGDPHGHGGGDGGWTVPDEIGPRRFVRGTLGMPKSVKDDGGCQVFVMHTAYRPLDERYTAYGQVVCGMAAVDALRVGDRIVSTRVVRR
jgi:cyclophilin family peptidyl-prolyl cis-trans isomerase